MSSPNKYGSHIGDYKVCPKCHTNLPNYAFVKRGVVHDECNWCRQGRVRRNKSGINFSNHPARYLVRKR